MEKERIPWIDTCMYFLVLHGVQLLTCGGEVHGPVILNMDRTIPPFKRSWYVGQYRMYIYVLVGMFSSLGVYVCAFSSCVLAS